ncbi:MAG TPA: hypothetical protein VD993_01355 [Chitinophagaceae bacterium]|nr:hypothetical protein [Chitinophagaceae bacterium]
MKEQSEIQTLGCIHDGMKTSSDIIKSLVQLNEDIAELKFHSFNKYDAIQDRLEMDDTLEDLVEKALQLRAQYKLPFWDAFNACTFDTAFSKYHFLKHVRFHNTINQTFIIRRTEVSQFLDALPEDKYLVINSNITMTNGHRKHLPLLDFHIPVGKENEDLCKAILVELGLKGFLLNSGKSYHFYGKELVDHEQMQTILHFALLFSPIVDKSWIAHQLIEGSCNLRVTKKYSRLPCLVMEV